MAASPPLSAAEPSINDNSRSDAPASMSESDKFSLSHYFSRRTVVFVSFLIVATIALFIWSNSSDGAWVSLQVTPIVPTSDDDVSFTSNEWLPTMLTVLSMNGKLSPSTKASLLNTPSMHSQYQSIDTLSQLLSDTDNLNRFTHSMQQILARHHNNNNNMSLSIDMFSSDSIKQRIADLSLNKNMFHFSLVSSIRDFWQSRAYSLAILVCGFSGIWPYIKLALLAVCWLIPLRQNRREAILIFLDQMGKFSFIDLFVSMYMIVSFYVSVTKELKSYGVTLKIVVEPDIGLNTFVIGTVISMLFSHVFLFLDAKYAKAHIRRLQYPQQRDGYKLQHDDDQHHVNGHDAEVAQAPIGRPDPIMEDDALRKSQLQNLPLDTQWNTGLSPFFMRYAPHSLMGALFRSLMLVMIWATLWSVVESTFAAPVRYELQGLIGAFVDDPVRAFSPLQIVLQVPSHTDEHWTAPWLSTCFFFTIIAFPIMLNVCIALIWFLPLKYKHLQSLNIFMQFCMAWSALDVYAVASVAASLELERVSQWIMNANYAEICGDDGIIPQITEKLFGTSASCFDVEGKLVWGIYVVIYASVALWILFMYSIHQLYQSKKYLQRAMHRHVADHSIFMFNH